MAKIGSWKRPTPINKQPTRKSKRLGIIIPQPTKYPFYIKGKDVVDWVGLKGEPDWYVLHKRIPQEIIEGYDPREMRAIPKEQLRGSLPERIVYKYLTVQLKLVDNVDFTFQCLAGHHKVLTKDLKWVEIRNLKPGDLLLNISENRKLEGTKVNKRVWETGVVTYNEPFLTDAIEVSLSDGNKIITTPEHPWLVRYSKHYWGFHSNFNWVETKDLKIGTIVPKFVDVWETDTSWESGYLAGFFDGEGSLIQGQQSTHKGNYMTLTASQNAGVTFDNFVRAIAKTGFNFSIYDYRNKHKRSYDNGYRQCIHLRISGGRAEALRFLGTIRPPRLINKLDSSKMGRVHCIDNVTITDIKPIGKHEIYKLAVSNHTYIAEGFAMHNSAQEGGRVELGGFVCDFVFPYLKLVIQVQGVHHKQYLQERKDEQQEDVMAEFGYRVEDLWEDEIYDEYRFENRMRKIFNLASSVGSAYGASEPSHTLMDGTKLDTQAVRTMLGQLDDIKNSIAGIA